MGSSSTSNTLIVPRACQLIGVYIGGFVLVGNAATGARIFVCPNAVANDQPNSQIESVICEHSFDVATEQTIPPQNFFLSVPMYRGQQLCVVAKAGASITLQAWVTLVFAMSE